MDLDVRSLVTLLAITNLASAIVMFGFYRLFREVAGPKYWAIATALIVLAAVFMLMRQLIPIEISIVLGNFTYSVASAFFYIGMCRFTEKKLSRPLLFSILLTGLIAFLLLPKTSDYIAQRAMVNAFEIATLSLMSSWVLIKGAQKVEIARKFVGYVFGLLGFINIIRFTYLQLNEIDFSNYLTSTAIFEQLIHLAFIVLQIAYVSGLIIMVSEKLKNALEIQLNDVNRYSDLMESQAKYQTKLANEKENFLSMLTHELRTPLTVIRMAIGSSPNMSKESKNDVETSIDEMERVISFVNSSGRIEAKLYNPNNISVNLPQLLQNLPIIQRNSHKVVTKNLEEKVVQTDPELVSTIISNLIDNAIKYGAEDALVSLDCKVSIHGHNSSFIKITVSNYPGVARWPDPDRLFEKYYRSAYSHHFTGSGLGLYLANGLAQIIHAKLEYEPTLNQVSFALYLPLDQ